MRAANLYPIRGLLGVALIVAVTAPTIPRSAAADEPPLTLSTGRPIPPPFGWTKFCIERPQECKVAPASEREVVLSPNAYAELVRINKWVNAAIRPKRDLDHYGEVDKCAYPDDGYGDCEDYVLLKRRMLMEAGWPREALLITVVLDNSGEGHAVLMVKTDRGDFILDNLNQAITLRARSSYRFLSQQSRSNPNLWISLLDPNPAVATAASR